MLYSNNGIWLYIEQIKESEYGMDTSGYYSYPFYSRYDDDTGALVVKCCRVIDVNDFSLLFEKLYSMVPTLAHKRYLGLFRSKIYQECTRDNIGIAAEYNPNETTLVSGSITSSDYWVCNTGSVNTKVTNKKETKDIISYFYTRKI